MLGFDTATSTFLTLLIKKTYRKNMKKAKKKFELCNIKSKPFFVTKVLPSNPSPRLEKFCWPVMVVKLRKGQKI